MAEDKPMTVKERMAALARASSGGNSGPTPAPPKAAGTSTGPSVAERLAKMRAGPGGTGPSPGGGSPTTGKKPGLVRTFTPPTSAPTVVTQSPGRGRGPPRSSGGSSIADKIAALSGSGGGLPPSPSGAPADSSTPPKLAKTTSGGDGNEKSSNSPVNARDSPRVSAGLAARMECMKLTPSSPASSASAVGGSEKKDTAAPAASGKTSPGLAARMGAINRSSDSLGGIEKATQEKADGDEGLPPPPALATSGSSSSSASKVSPGLAARMGKAIPIPMPGGALPIGGLAELKRRKQEKELAERGGADAAGEETKPPETAEEQQQQPGQLKHANLSRATIPQRRRPRKAARPFKPTATAPSVAAAAAGAPPASTEAAHPVVTEEEADSASALAKVTPPEAAADVPPEGGGAEENDATAATAATAEAADPPATGGEGEDPAEKMKSMLKAASFDTKEGDGDDDEWE